MEIQLSKNILHFFPIQNSLKTHFLFFETLKKVSDKLIQVIPFIEELRGNKELTLLVSNIVEELIPPKAGVNKKKLVVCILNRIFNGSLTPDEIKNTEKDIDYNYQHKEIKRVSFFKKRAFRMRKFFSRFFF